MHHCKTTSHQLNVLEYEGRNMPIFTRCFEVLSTAFQDRDQLNYSAPSHEKNNIYALQMRHMLQRQEPGGPNYLEEAETHLSKVLKYERRNLLILTRCLGVLSPAIQDRVDQLYATPSHQNDIYALQMRHLLQEQEQPDGPNYMEEAETLLSKYEEKERMFLLELAVWKAACIVVASSMAGWHENKEECRNDNMIEIVLKHVRSFLVQI